MKSLRIFLLATLILVFFGLDNVEASKEPEWSYATDYFASSVAISSDGEYIVAGSDDRNVYFFDKDSRRPLTGKFSTARCVEAPHSASAGTSISPIVSFSTRV